MKLPFDFWNWIERVEKIASIAGAIGTIVIPILILKYEYSAKKEMLKSKLVHWNVSGNWSKKLRRKLGLVLWLVKLKILQTRNSL